MFLLKRERNLPELLWVAICYGLLTIVSNQWNPVSVNVMFQQFYILGGIVFFAVYYQGHTEEGQEYLLNGMAIGCLLQCLFVLTEWLGFDLYQLLIISFNEVAIERAPGMEDSLNGTLGNPNLTGAYIALSAFSLFRMKWFGLLPVPIVALSLIDSSMATVSLMAGSAYWLNNHFKLIPKYFLYIGAAALMVCAYFFIKGYDSGRFSSWAQIIGAMDLEHFTLGKGPGWFADNGRNIVSGRVYMQEHNEFLALINTFGIVGLAIISPVIYQFMKSKDERPIFAAILFAAFCNAFGHFNLHQSTTAIIIIVSASICLAGGSKYVGNI